MCVLAMLLTQPGTVALKRMNCTDLAGGSAPVAAAPPLLPPRAPPAAPMPGTPPRIFCTSSAKPMSSILSASSSTTCLTLVRRRLPPSMRSMTRPGVPTSTSTPPRSAPCCGKSPTPPYTHSVTRRTSRLEKSSPTCLASSRVGASTSARGARPRASLAALSPRRRSMMGSAKASVLPEPVRALAIMSRPASSRAKDCAWMGKSEAMPRLVSAATVSGCSAKALRGGCAAVRSEPVAAGAAAAAAGSSPASLRVRGRFLVAAAGAGAAASAAGAASASRLRFLASLRALRSASVSSAASGAARSFLGFFSLAAAGCCRRNSIAARRSSSWQLDQPEAVARRSP